MGLEFQKRLETACKKAGGATTLAQLAGISRRTLSLYLSGKVDPTRKRLINLAKASGVHVHWLATGWGPSNGSVNYLDEEFIRVPLLSPKGEPRHTLAIGKPFLSGYLSASADDLVLVESPDSSMEPTIDCNELVLVDRARTTISSHKVYCIRCHDEFIFRRIVAYPHDGSVELHCDRYHCQKTFTKDDIAQLEIVGQALFGIKKTK